jgi:hypothetical protein
MPVVISVSSRRRWWWWGSGDVCRWYADGGIGELAVAAVVVVCRGGVSRWFGGVAVFAGDEGGWRCLPAVERSGGGRRWWGIHGGGGRRWELRVFSASGSGGWSLHPEVPLVHGWSLHPEVPLVPLLPWQLTRAQLSLSCSSPNPNQIDPNSKIDGIGG